MKKVVDKYFEELKQLDYFSKIELINRLQNSLKNDKNNIVIEKEKLDKLFGALNKYADPELRKSEKEAWKNHIRDKYDNSRFISSFD